MTSEPRSAYKSVWTALSATQQQAVAHVIGEVDEAAIQAAARDTRHWLEVSVGIKPNDVILEIGCGIGRVGQVLAPICKQWIGCDVSPNMLRHARERLAGFSNVRFVELSGYDLRSIEDASVVLVYCTVVFMHLDEWERY
ncbi:MAG: class I SAM-dependent methyltransferase, partial [Chloroflexota bacterium]|nr:class I SAM-dependent methyltransferase [Chloroflexota bacterium]